MVRRIALTGLAIMLPILAVLAQSQSGPNLPVGNYTTPSQVQSLIQGAMPAAATATPPATALDGATGSAVQYARADHTHAARVQRTVLTTATDGTATWTFARPIVVASGKLPPVTFMVEDTGTPIAVQIIGRTFTTSGGQDTHTAVTIKAVRSRALPATILALTALVSYDIFGIPGGSVRVNLFAADPTQ